MQGERCCLICGTTRNLHKHHCLHGTANRKNAEKYGLWVYLCGEHHAEVHAKHSLDLQFKQRAQREFEKTHTREEFRRVFGKSWL